MAGWMDGWKVVVVLHCGIIFPCAAVGGIVIAFQLCDPLFSFSC